MNLLLPDLEDHASFVLGTFCHLDQIKNMQQKTFFLEYPLANHFFHALSWIFHQHPRKNLTVGPIGVPVHEPYAY